MPTYWLNLFTPITWKEAKACGFKVTGFRRQRWPIVSKVRTGDFFVCYITELGRFSGILRATSAPYHDEAKAKQIWKEDFFPNLIDVKPVVALDFLHSIPKTKIISKLTIASKWGGLIRGSPVRIPPEDGELIKRMLTESDKKHREYPIPQKTGRRAGKHTHPMQQYRTIGLLTEKAWQTMGVRAKSRAEKIEVDFDQARVAIDTIAFLAEKVQPHLPDIKKRRLERIVADLRRNFVRLEKAQQKRR